MLDVTENSSTSNRQAGDTSGMMNGENVDDSIESPTHNESSVPMDRTFPDDEQASLDNNAKQGENS